MPFNFIPAWVRNLKEKVPDGVNLDRVTLAGTFLGILYYLYENPKTPVDLAFKSVEAIVKRIEGSEALNARPMVAMALMTTTVTGVPAAALSFPSYLTYTWFQRTQQMKIDGERQRNEQIEVGREAMRRGEYATAFQCFQKAIDIHKSISRVNSWYFFYYITPRGDESFDKLIELSFWAAEALFLNGQYQEARDKFGEILKLKPDDSLSLRMCGVGSMLLGNIDFAVSNFNAYFRLNPMGHNEVRILLASCESAYREVTALADGILFIGMDISDDGLWATLSREHLAHIVLDKIAAASQVLQAGAQERIGYIKLEFSARYNIFQHCREALSPEQWHIFLREFDACCTKLTRNLGEGQSLIIPLIRHESCDGHLVTARAFNGEGADDFQRSILQPALEINGLVEHPSMA